VTVQESSVVESTDDPDRPILTATYDEEQLLAKNVLPFRVQDLRPCQTPVDFELVVLTPTAEKITVAIFEGEIADFTVAPGNGDFGRFDSDAISDFAAEHTDASAKSVTHSFAISFTHLLPEMLEYCAAVPDYEMAATDLDADYYELTS